MTISFGEIILYSHNPARLMHFISFILDLEADLLDNEDIQFQFDGIKFKIHGLDKLNKKQKASFRLKVCDEAELAEIKNLVEFYYYKEGVDSFKLPLIHENILSFIDPDGRSWEIFYDLPLHNAMAKTILQQSNVRNG